MGVGTDCTLGTCGSSGTCDICGLPGTPCCGGFTSAEVLELLRGFAGINLVGADVVEVLPDRDPAGITSLLAAHLIMEILALPAVR